MPIAADYPVHDVILMWQDRILSQLLSPLTLERLHDSELKVAGRSGRADHGRADRAADEGDLRRSRQRCKEGEFTNRKPAISSLRRNLQRAYLQRLSQTGHGQPAHRTIARRSLTPSSPACKSGSTKCLKGDAKLDDYSRAHLIETKSRIKKVLDAQLTLKQP